MVVLVLRFPVVDAALEKPLNMFVAGEGNCIPNMIVGVCPVVDVTSVGFTGVPVVVAMGADVGEAAAATATTAGAVVVTVTVAVVVVAPPNIGMLDWPPKIGVTEVPAGRAGIAVLAVLAVGRPVDRFAMALSISCACGCIVAGRSFKVDAAVVAGFGTKENG